jgi:hypothetical protein
MLDILLDLCAGRGLALVYQVVAESNEASPAQKNGYLGDK